MKPDMHNYIKLWRAQNPELTKLYGRTQSKKYYGWKSIAKVFANILIHEVYPDFQQTKKMGRPAKLKEN